MKNWPTTLIRIPGAEKKIPTTFGAGTRQERSVAVPLNFVVDLCFEEKHKDSVEALPSF